jgi:MFS family permease
MLIALRLREPAPERRPLRWREDLTAGVRHIAAVRPLRQVVVACVGVVLVIGFAEAANFGLVEDGLHRPPEFLGVMGTIVGAGAVAGALSSPWLLTRIGPGRLTATGMAASGTGALLLITGVLPVVLVALAVRGFGLPLILVGLYTLLQQRTPLDLQGRAAAAVNTLVSIPLSGGIAVGAVLASFTGYRTLLAVIAVSGLAGALYLATRPEQRQDRSPVTAAAEH